MPDIFMSQRQENNRCQCKEIGRLISIWKGSETTLVVPEGQGNVSRIKCDTKRGKEHHASSENAQLLAYFPQFQIKSTDVIKPGDARQKTDETPNRNPWLRRKSCRKLDMKVSLHSHTPERTHKPISRKECCGHASDGSQQDEIKTAPERKLWRIDNQD